MLNDPHADKRKSPESCLTCRFFFPSPKTHATGSGTGDCRRFPPNAGVVEGHATTYAAGWCGEYKADELKIAHLKTLNTQEK